MTYPSPIAESAVDKRKFVLNFDCERVAQEVEFKWTELTAGTSATTGIARLENCECSGIGSSGCPVGVGSVLRDWHGCPRMARLEQRLHRTQPLAANA